MTTLVVVNYKTAGLARRAIASARASSDEPLHVIAVDNSEDGVEAEQLREVADDVIVPASNVGYGRAVNLARQRIGSDTFIASNPDVVFGADSIPLLVSELRRGASVAGPGLHWDEAMEWVLPPSREHRWREKLSEVMASRSGAWSAKVDRDRVAERMRFWAIDRATDVETISGAVMAFTTELFDAAGGFDERFWLYFEETDLLRRMRRDGHVVRYVPSARVRHLFNQSAVQSSRAAAAYLQSEQLYHERWDSARFFRAVKRLERPARPVAMSNSRLVVARSGMFVEVSPVPSFSVAAGRMVDEGVVTLPADVLQSVHGQRVYGRAIDPDSLRPGPAHVIAGA